jgi:simple sugar transport system substrate-binding protein
MSKFAPKAHLTAATNNWGPLLHRHRQGRAGRTWKTSEVRGGLKEGMVKMSGLNAVVPADAAKIFEEKKAALTAGHLEPFTGPIKDQSGAIKYPAVQGA